MSIVKKRLSPDQSRAAALSAARQLLIEMGPQAVTLKAVADKIGRTHANVLHHFGSAAELQKSLAEMMAKQVCASIATVVTRARHGEDDPGHIVEMCFDAFDAQGAGALVTWMILTGNRDAIKPILEAIHNLVDELSVSDDHDFVARSTLNLVFLSLSQALMGPEMTQALDLPPNAARDLALVHVTREGSGLVKAPSIA
jgi:AcrR family transcriptional regulator